MSLTICALSLPATATAVQAVPVQEQATSTTAARRPAASVQYDSSAIALRTAENTLKKFRGNPDFNYEKAVRPTPTLWERLLMWLYSLLDNIAPRDDTGARVWRVIIYVVLGVVLLIAVLRLTGMSFRSVFGRASRPIITTEEFKENIHEINFDTLIEEAVQQQDYRRATRLLYLRSLKQLSDKEYIRWSMDKTNRDYLRELPTGDVRSHFERLTLLFEYTWYGDFPIDKVLFEQSRALFNNFGTLTVQRV